MRKKRAEKSGWKIRGKDGSTRFSLRNLTTNQKWALFWIIEGVICCILASNGIGFRITGDGLVFSTHKPDNVYEYQKTDHTDNGSMEWLIESYR